MFKKVIIRSLEDRVDSGQIAYCNQTMYSEVIKSRYIAEK